MKLIVEITDEYYNLLQEFPVYQCTLDMLILKMGKPLLEPKWVEIHREDGEQNDSN